MGTYLWHHHHDVFELPARWVWKSMPTGAQLHPKLVVDSSLLLLMSIRSQNINEYLIVSCRAICRGFAAICCRNSDLADLAHNYRVGPRPDCLIGIGNALYWTCLMTDHEHENQTCPFGELNLGVGLPNWGKTQMQHDTPPEPYWQVTGVSYQ